MHPSIPGLGPTTQRGYTLGEMLVVVTIVAALTGVAWGAYANLARSEADRLAAVQLDQAALAVRAFRADTGYWPGAGPFALAPAGNVETADVNGDYQCTNTTAGLVVRARLPDQIILPLSAVDVDQWRTDWFTHPANLRQLLEAPVLCANHPLGRLARWDDESRRGWRGPYLDPGKALWVDAGNAAPGYESEPIQRNLPNVPTGAPYPPLAPCVDSDVPCAFRWRIAESFADSYESGRDQRASAGRPFFYFGPDSGRVRLAHGGPDGRFGGFDPNAPCGPNLTLAEGADDLVRCLD